MGPKSYFTIVLLVGIISTIHADNAGVKMRMTEKAIRYLEPIVSKQISYIVERLTLKDVEGSLGNISYNITHTTIGDVTYPKIEVELDSGNSSNGEISVRARNLSLLLSTDYSVAYSLLYGFEVPLTGSVDALFGQADIDFKLSLISQPEHNYMPVPRSLDCNVNIKNLDVIFTGDLEWLLNLLKSLFLGTIKSTLQDQICNVMTTLLDEKGAANTYNVKLISTFADVFVIDYTHTAPISITKHYLEGRHLGEIYWKNGRKSSPFVAFELPEFPAETDKMIYFMLSEYTAKTLAYTAHTEDYLQFVLSRDTGRDLEDYQNHYQENPDIYQQLIIHIRRADTISNILPTVEAYYNPRDSSFCSLKEADNITCLQHDSLSDYLFTTCPGKLCVGSIIKELGQRYPNTSSRVVIKSNRTPDVIVTSDNIAVTLYGDVHLNVLASPDTYLSFLSLQVIITLNGTAYSKQARASANITQFSSLIKNVKFHIEEIDESSASDFLNSALDLFIIPQLKKIASFGLPLPSLSGVKHENVSLALMNGAVLIATDVTVGEEEYLSFFP